MCIGDVRVDPHDDVAGQHVQALPERLAFPAARTVSGQDVAEHVHRDTLLACDRARSVVGIRVDDRDLVDQRDPFHEARADRTDDVADRRLLVQRGQTDGNAEVLPFLGLD